jgi:hypothetical protein
MLLGAAAAAAAEAAAAAADDDDVRSGRVMQGGATEMRSMPCRSDPVNNS